MKIDWEMHGWVGIYLLVGTVILAIVYTFLDGPWAGVVNIIPPLIVVYIYLAGRFVQRTRLKGQQLKEEIRELGGDLTLQDDFTIDDLDALYEVEELEQIIVVLKAMPIGQRNLQDAIAVIEKQDKE